MMTEDFLHYIWKYRLFNLHNLQTQHQQQVQIESVGQHNLESGPDFFAAKVKIENLSWVGQVEVHINSSDWYRHQHQNDAAYLKTILHVVWNHDREVMDLNNEPIPTLELKGRVSGELLANYQHLRLSPHQLLCKGLTDGLDTFKTNQWLERLLVERLERKVADLRATHELTKGDWEQTFFIHLCKNLGFKTNALPMQLLAKSIDFKILLKYRDRLPILEAILLGVGGFLETQENDPYIFNLQREFSHQQNKFHWNHLNSDIWKFGRIRPSNFPNLRLVQLAGLFHRIGNPFDFLVRDFNAHSNLEELNVKASTYWDTHYTFKNATYSKEKFLGRDSINNIVINTVAPMLFFFGIETGLKGHQQMALDVLDSIPSENNNIIRSWNQNNIKSASASQSQSLIQLTNNYCVLKKCLTCGIGKQILEK